MATENWYIAYDLTLADAMKDLVSLDPDVNSVFHSRLDATTAALDVLNAEWSGPIATYPDAGRLDYTVPWQDRRVPKEESVGRFTEETQAWADMGAQVVGTCCGFGVSYVEPLGDALPNRISSPKIG